MYYKRWSATPSITERVASKVELNLPLGVSHNATYVNHASPPPERENHLDSKP